MINPVGSLYPNLEEQKYFRQNFVEGANLLGRTGVINRVISTEQRGTDTFYKYDKVELPISYYLIDRPKPTQLTKYGWFFEDKQKLPIVCYLTYLSKDKEGIYLQEGDLITISVRDNPNKETYNTRKFMAHYPTVDMDLNMFVCQLIPYREKQYPIQPNPSIHNPYNEDRFFYR